ncbi:lycopene cyclase domain-containing protein [Algoriphagus marinus]|uniref:lycopene cyclase domain-containing protein n=1 Tax=Algoriphagus marinus TaxID=1925762 RepID=UPI00094B8EBE|nr:lycopene cyclase domain-containing protein [Algoriphagus marinus]
MEKFLYLSLNLFAISYPLARSFESRVKYSKQWYALFPAILITGVIFLIWDHYFTLWGVWEFNPRYNLGYSFFGLPLEEWLFFLTVPYACIFIYEVLIYFFPKDIFKPAGKPLVFVLVPLLIGFGFLHLDKMYTSVNAFFAAAVLILHFVIFGDKYLGRFIFAYLVVLIPFFLCNGILTGGMTEEPVVIYNNSENLGIRIWTVPIEDTVYNLSLLLLNISIFEFIRSRKTFHSSKSL